MLEYERAYDSTKISRNDSSFREVLIGRGQRKARAGGYKSGQNVSREPRDVEVVLFSYKACFSVEAVFCCLEVFNEATARARNFRFMYQNPEYIQGL
jgi:hypothetical protein